MKKSSSEVAITPKTKIKVGTNIRGIANGLFATVVKIVNNCVFFICFFYLLRQEN